jgi:hypothetical protein
MAAKSAKAAMAKAQPKKQLKPTAVNRDNKVKVKTKADQPSKYTTPTAKSRNQPYY